MKKPQKQTEALKLWLSGEGREKICKELQIGNNTFDKWRKEKNWDQYREKHEAEVMQKVSVDLIEERERSLKLIKAIESIFAKMINEGQVEVKVSDFATIQKVKWDILLPRSQQFNFMKQDLNVTIKPEELNRAMEALREYERRIRAKPN